MKISFTLKEDLYEEIKCNHFFSIIYLFFYVCVYLCVCVHLCFVCSFFLFFFFDIFKRFRTKPFSDLCTYLIVTENAYFVKEVSMDPFNTLQLCYRYTEDVPE